MNNKPNRRRNKAVTIRMTNEEYESFMNKVDESGLSQQSFFLHSIQSAVVSTSKELEELKNISNLISDYDRQLRGMATNVNQMAHIANGTGALPEYESLNELSSAVIVFKKEVSDIWQSLRSSIQVK